MTATRGRLTTVKASPAAAQTKPPGSCAEAHRRPSRSEIQPARGSGSSGSREGSEASVTEKAFRAGRRSGALDLDPVSPALCSWRWAVRPIRWATRQQTWHGFFPQMTSGVSGRQSPSAITASHSDQIGTILAPKGRDLGTHRPVPASPRGEPDGSGNMND